MADDFRLTIVQGERLTISGAYDNGATPPVALPLPGAIRWQVRRYEGVDSDLVLDLTDYVTANLAAGTFTLDVPASVTRTVTLGGWHDAFAGDVRLFEGTAVVDRATTAAS